ncbi:MAG: hypothetical protein JNM00_07730, partial [Flavobacteriales bacterium]|nr:hypothetical protein [Flavobacteriales bacterium]
CGASISVNASVSYVDTQAPVYPPATPTYYVINCMMPQPTAPVFTDNCDGALDITISSLATAENILEKTFTATDDCGNSTSVTYIIETGCCTPACPGDFNDDGVVNVSDLLIFSSMFGSSGICLSADINLDGVVNITDLLLFSSTFGTTCDTFGGSN